MSVVKLTNTEGFKTCSLAEAKSIDHRRRALEKKWIHETLHRPSFSIKAELSDILENCDVDPDEDFESIHVSVCAPGIPFLIPSTGKKNSPEVVPFSISRFDLNADDQEINEGFIVGRPILSISLINGRLSADIGVSTDGASNSYLESFNPLIDKIHREEVKKQLGHKENTKHPGFLLLASWNEEDEGFEDYAFRFAWQFFEPEMYLNGWICFWLAYARTAKGTPGEIDLVAVEDCFMLGTDAPDDNLFFPCDRHDADDALIQAEIYLQEWLEWISFLRYPDSRVDADTYLEYRNIPVDIEWIRRVQP